MPKQAAALGGRVPIQDTFADLDISEREIRISGTHSACWNAMFGPRYGPNPATTSSPTAYRNPGLSTPRETLASITTRVRRRYGERRRV